MSKLLSYIFGVLKYILLLAAFIIIFYGIIATYKRLDKSLVDAIPIFIPFVLLLITFVINLFIKSNIIRENLLFNFTAVVLLSAIIIIGLRAKFDTNMMIYYKYKIGYNPLFLSDNISVIRINLYVLFVSNLMLIVSTLFEDKKEEFK